MSTTPAPDSHELASQIRTQVVAPLLPRAARDTFGDHDDLLAALDSLHILRMVLSLESHFGVKIDHADMTAENLGSVARLGALVATKLVARGQQ